MSEVSDQVPAFLKTRLSVMMLLQFAIWGSWLPILYPFLLGHRGFNLDQVGSILAAGALGAIIGPFIAGQVADRHFSTEKFLGVSHLAGAVLVFALSWIDAFWPFLLVSILYGLVYAPTLALTNSLSFHHLPDRDKDFGKVRLWGTVGWILAGIAVGQWLYFNHTPSGETEAVIKAAQDAGRADAFRLSAILGVAMGLYCFTLPRTPPARDAAEKNATLRAIKEIRLQPLVTLFLLSVPISIIHQLYFVHASSFLTGVQNRAGGSDIADAINAVFGVGGGGLMTIGQMAEVAVIACIPLFAKKISRKALLAMGITAYAVRMLLFGQMDTIAGFAGIPEIVIAIAGITMHGFCFGCFIFVAFMVVDEETTPDIRASAQNLYNLVFVGIGIIVGSWFSTSIVGRWATEEITNAAGEAETITHYDKLFGVPMWMAIACLVALVVFYPKRGRFERTGSEPSAGEPPAGQ
ncbi:MAG: MFS transporter [Phycisphaerales bacterium]